MSKSLTYSRPSAAQRRWKAVRRNWEAYLLFLPVLVWYVIFCYMPMGGLVIAFKQFSPIKGIADSPFIGMANFTRIFSTPSFLAAVRNTLILSALNLIIVFPIPILFAILLNEIRHQRFKKIVQTISYLPHFISWSVVGGLLYMLMAPQTGAINNLIVAFGGEAKNYMGISQYFRTIAVGSTIWKTMGWSAIVYIAAITNVDEQLYEAAYIDGAGRLRRIWHITLPGIRSTIAVLLILQIGSIMNSNFDQIFMLVNDMTLDVGETIDYYIYRIGLSASNNFSLATASGMIKSVIGFVLVVAANALSKKISDGEGIW
ncbi:ABC transporter permease subunit [Ruminococcaceae bacterium OttesenSCG-928-L11]|nr:ABC transporter permease subunit [Ruminococcaceae bacterium OttesenSCG-928-L11]